MGILKPLAFVGCAWLAAGSTASADVQLVFENGQVSLVAQDATVRQILTEWARLGRTTIVNVERIPAEPVKLELKHVSERQALDVLLRSVSGYIAVPRANDVANASSFDRIIVMPTSVAPAAAATVMAGTPAPMLPQPREAGQVDSPTPQLGRDDRQDEDRPAPNVAVPARGPVFNPFAQPQIVNPQVQGAPAAMPGVAAQLAVQPQAPPQGAPQGAIALGDSQPGTARTAQPAAVSAGSTVPGMAVPSPPQPGAAPPQGVAPLGDLRPGTAGTAQPVAPSTGSAVPGVVAPPAFQPGAAPPQSATPSGGIQTGPTRPGQPAAPSGGSTAPGMIVPAPPQMSTVPPPTQLPPKSSLPAGK